MKMRLPRRTRMKKTRSQMRKKKKKMVQLARISPKQA